MKENKMIIRIKSCADGSDVLVSCLDITCVDVYESETIPDGISKIIFYFVSDYLPYLGIIEEVSLINENNEVFHLDAPVDYVYQCFMNHSVLELFYED